jgi:hypothetical protein
VNKFVFTLRDNFAVNSKPNSKQKGYHYVLLMEKSQITHKLVLSNRSHANAQFFCSAVLVSFLYHVTGSAMWHSTHLCSTVSSTGVCDPLLLL